MIKFFRHNSTAADEPGCKYLRVHYGFAGFGQYFALCGMIAQQENCKLDLSKKFNLLAAASIVEMDIAEFITFKDMCIECEILISEGDDIITSPEIMESMETQNTTKERNKRYYESKKGLNPAKPEKVEKNEKKEPTTPTEPSGPSKNDKERKSLILGKCEKEYLPEEKEYFVIAKSFHDLFIEHHGTNKKVLNGAKYGLWVDSVRLMITHDKRTVDELRSIRVYLNRIRHDGNPFWINTSMSIANIRKNFDQIISKVEQSGKPNQKPIGKTAKTDSSYE